MLVNNGLDEIKKRENAFNIIKTLIEKNKRSFLIDLTGLAGAFIASKSELNLLETYVGPAIFEEELELEGIKHLGGQKVLGLNRTSSGILASILALVPRDSHVCHFLPEFPSHPSIPRSCKLVNASYSEYCDINDFQLEDNTSLVFITGSTMDHQVINEDDFKKVIELAQKRDIPVCVDDASGARLRTVVRGQKRACDLGADIVITSTDKLMPGPRGGLMAGRTDLINKIKVKANEFGLEAQVPSIIAMINGLKNFKSENLISSLNSKDELYELLSEEFDMFNKTPTGIKVLPEDLVKELEKRGINTKFSNDDIAFIFSMILLKYEGIITIPAVSMPGASTTVRFDLSTKDAFKISLNDLNKKIKSSFNKLEKIAINEDKAYKLLFEA